MVGPFINVGAIVLGGLLGAHMGKHVPEHVRKSLPLTFGLASMCIGISLIIKMHFLPVVILALLLGSFVGEMLQIEKIIQKQTSKLRGVIERVTPEKSKAILASREEFLDKYVVLFVMVCTGSTGILGALNEGMTGDASLLIVKSFLDFFTMGIFAITLGYAIITIAIPLLIIQAILFCFARFIMSFISPEILADFSACGGVLVFAVGFRLCDAIPFSLGNLLPALVFVVPISALWFRCFV